MVDVRIIPKSTLPANPTIGRVPENLRFPGWWNSTDRRIWEAKTWTEVKASFGKIIEITDLPEGATGLVFPRGTEFGTQKIWPLGDPHLRYLFKNPDRREKGPHSGIDFRFMRYIQSGESRIAIIPGGVAVRALVSSIHIFGAEYQNLFYAGCGKYYGLSHIQTTLPEWTFIKKGEAVGVISAFAVGHLAARWIRLQHLHLSLYENDCLDQGVDPAPILGIQIQESIDEPIIDLEKREKGD